MVYKIQINKGTRNRRNFGLAYQIKNSLAQKRGGGGGKRSDSEESGSLIGGTSFHSRNSLWLHQELLPHLISTRDMKCCAL